MPITTPEEARKLIEERKAVRMQMAQPEQVVEQINTQPPEQQATNQAPISTPERLAEGVMGGIERFADTARTRISAATGDENALNALGKREGVPFDVESGAGIMARMTQELAFNRDERTALYMRMPNVESVRYNHIGEPVLTVKDGTTGETRDILANPVGIDPSDFAFVAANIPELVGGMFGAIGKKATKEAIGNIQKIGQWMMSKDVIPSAGRMAVVGQAAGGVKDMIGRGVHPALEADAGDIATRRGVSATADFLFGLGAGAAGSITSRALTPLSKRGPLQLNAEAAQELWASKGVKIDLTPAEMTGSPFLSRSEAFMAQKPGSSIAFDAIMDRRREQVGKIQNILLGADKSLIPAVDIVGGQASRAVQAKVAPLDFAVSRETQALLKAASDEIQRGVSRAAGTATVIPESAIGSKLSERSFQRLEEFRAQSKDLYGRVYSNPAVAGKGRNIDVTPLAKDAKQILVDVASVEKPVEKATGLLDEFGQSISRETSETQQLSSFVDSGALSKLRQLADSEGGSVSLRDLIELRRDIDDELFRSGAIGGLPERRLSNIRDSITQRIEGGLKELDDSGKLLADFQAANKHYSENIRRFKEVDIAEMFKGPQDRGVLGFNQIVTRAITDTDRWRSYSDFFGATSPEMTMMRRAYADRVLGRLPGDDTIDAGAFLSRLEGAFRGNSKEIAVDVFGNSVSQLRGLAMAAEQAGKNQVNVDELAKLIDQKSLTADKLRSLMAAQSERDQTLKNGLIAKIAKGIDGPDSIKPSEFVNKVVFKGEPGEIDGVMARLSDQPELLEQIRQHTLLKIFADSSTDVAGKETLSAVALSKYLDNEITVKQLEPVLGSATLNDLRALRDVLKPGAVNEQTFSAAGRLSAGSQVANIERQLGNPASMWGEVGRIAKSWLLATMYKTGPVRNYIANADIAPSGKIADRDAFINSFVVAEPVVEDLLRVFGEETGRLIAMEIKGAIDANIRQNPNAVQLQNIDPKQLIEQAKRRRTPAQAP